MIPRISIKLALYMESGLPCGGRIERGTPLPTYDFTFDDTEEGRKKAELARQQLQDYVDRHHVPKSKGGKSA